MSRSQEASKKWFEEQKFPEDELQWIRIRGFEAGFQACLDMIKDRGPTAWWHLDKPFKNQQWSSDTPLFQLPNHE